MTLPSQRRFAGVLAHHDGEVVLVRETHVRWGGEFWNIPSGMVEAHETPARGAARELAEETGLVVSSRRFPVHDAIEQLRMLPYRPLAEPAIATLHAGAAAPSTHWTFASPEAEPRITRSV